MRGRALHLHLIFGDVDGEHARASLASMYGLALTVNPLCSPDGGCSYVLGLFKGCSHPGHHSLSTRNADYRRGLEGR